MSGRRAQSLPPHVLDRKPERGRCVSAICFSWKVITCVVSHVTLVLMVVSYCVGGAYLFQHLEKEHEIEIKKNIHNMRKNLTETIWKFSDNATYLFEEKWISEVNVSLSEFETQILLAMKTQGWDGDEDITKTQWTFAGSLFYSIIVITTIGYGHISPRTDWGKVTTIFYAIVGIPLMLLCLSNIGDIMATSFRFVYWRVCCYVCTRSSRRSDHRSRKRSIRSHRYSSRSQPPNFRHSTRLTQRSVNDSGIGTSLGAVAHAYSDSELRRNDPHEYDFNHRGSRRHAHRASARHTMPPCEEGAYNKNVNMYRNLQRLSGRQKNRNRFQDRHTIERERYVNRPKQHFDSIEDLNAASTQPSMAKRSLSVRSMRSSNTRHNNKPVSQEMHHLNQLQPQTLPRGRSMPHGTANARGRAKSVDPRVLAAQYEDDLDEDVIRKTPIIPNRYALEEFDHREAKQRSTLRSQSMPRSAHQRNHKNNYAASRERSQLKENPDDTTPHHHHSHQNNRYTNQHHYTEQQPQLRSHQRHLTPQPQPQTQPQRQHSQYGNRLELPEMMPSHGIRSRSLHPNDEYPNNSYYNRRGHSPRPCDYDNAYDERYCDDYDVEAAYEDYPVLEMHHRQRRQQRREKIENLPPSPRIMSPMGFAVKRQYRHRPSYDYDNDSFYDEWNDYYGEISPKNRPVPIWLCVFLVISYILGGALLFSHWEHWTFLDSAYFCFITLTTIGFGDFVPAKGVQDESEQSIAYCSLYLLFGISLLAMSFNLVQEEFIANVKELARRLGILKDDEDDDD